MKCLTSLVSRRLVLVALLVAGCARANVASPRQAARSLQATIPLRYLQYVPPTYATDPTDRAANDGSGWPLVLFLHGAGERGDDIEKVKTHGPPKLVASGKDFPFILLSPQAPAEGWWNAEVLGKLIDQAQATLHVDPDRIYVTGLSMGGFGTWDLARRFPYRFAAIAPVCGGGDLTLVSRTPAFKTLPIWAFHGEADPVIPVARSTELIATIVKAGNLDAKVTTYPGVGHDSWTQTYNNPALYEWLLSHKRIPAPPTTRPAG